MVMDAGPYRTTWTFERGGRRVIVSHRHREVDRVLTGETWFVVDLRHATRDWSEREVKVDKQDFAEAKRVALSMLDEAVKRSRKGGAK